MIDYISQFRSNRTFKRNGCCNSSGDIERARLSASYRPDGSIVVSEVSRYNIREYVNSFRDGTDIHKIVARYNASNDPSILGFDVSRFGGDASDVPLTKLDIIKVGNQVHNIYMNAPSTVRSKYTDVPSFLSHLNDPDVLSYLGFKPSNSSDGGGVNA